jgi:hypothetical protein
MSWTALASSLFLAVLAMIKTTTCKLCQMLVFIWYRILLEMMAAIELYHSADDLFLAFNPVHTVTSIIIFSGPKIQPS